MKYYVGLDVSMKTTALCIVDEKGKIIQEANIATDPDALAEAIRSASLPIELVGIESSALSFYLVEALEERKVPAICIDARKMNAILSVTINKNDKNDARGIANAMRTGMYTGVAVKPKEALNRGAVLAMRKWLVNQRTGLKNHIRGIIKAYGIRLGTVSANEFGKKVRAHTEHLELMVYEMIDAMLEVYEKMSEKLDKINKELKELAKADKRAKLLMTAHGIGPITALSFITEIHSPERFKKSKTVGAYCGMTPSQYASGETMIQGRISKCGSAELRTLLMEAGVSILTRSKKWSKLRAWGLKLMKKKGLKKAAMAVGRKLAVIMHRMLMEGKEFMYGEEQAA
ncbi:MAG: IS110 family transposase [Simkaniaceae bacterium]